jgi:hypothetical protein
VPNPKTLRFATFLHRTGGAWLALRSHTDEVRTRALRCYCNERRGISSGAGDERTSMDTICRRTSSLTVVPFASTAFMSSIPDRSTYTGTPCGSEEQPSGRGRNAT